ncbi:hypothetical protein [uncultured Kordia sp.]|uniref:hypothetical protein n=1 Tax=uncultured Kordia sp. TaxID=507699 RepID=UPI002633413D|nr:hypothetical protein [uncultured Kordia sp.]
MKKINIKYSLLLLCVAVLFIACKNDDDTNTNSSSTTVFDIFTVQSDNETVVMNGEIKSRTLQDFNNMLAAYPDIKQIHIAEVPGSSDDEINLQVGVKVHQKGINTHILNNGLIASGGVDFFLAGIQRTRGTNTQIGVHSWADGNGNEATDFPTSSSEHLRYIEYYEGIGYSNQWSRDFYFYTINAASAANIHWMTEAEITQYELITQ